MGVGNEGFSEGPDSSDNSDGDFMSAPGGGDAFDMEFEKDEKIQESNEEKGLKIVPKSRNKAPPVPISRKKKNLKPIFCDKKNFVIFHSLGEGCKKKIVFNENKFSQKKKYTNDQTLFFTTYGEIALHIDKLKLLIEEHNRFINELLKRDYVLGGLKEKDNNINERRENICNNLYLVKNWIGSLFKSIEKEKDQSYHRICEELGNFFIKTTKRFVMIEKRFKKSRMYDLRIKLKKINDGKEVKEEQILKFLKFEGSLWGKIEKVSIQKMWKDEQDSVAVDFMKIKHSFIDVSIPKEFL